MEKVIITGANGFIGRYVVNKLSSSNRFIYALDIRNAESSRDNTINIDIDLSKRSDLLEFCKNEYTASTMIHLAADITIPGSIITIGNNISCTINTIELAKKAKVRHYIYLSSIPVIGNIVYTPIDEDHPVKPKTLYHWSKYIGELLLKEQEDEFDRITIIRIPSPIGVGMRCNTFLPQLLGKLICGSEVEIFGEGQRLQNYIDVRDIAEAIDLIIDKKPQGVFLLSGKESISNWSLAMFCKSILKSTSRIYKGNRPDKQDSERWIISSKKAQEQFGFSSVYDLKSTIKWYCESIR